MRKSAELSECGSYRWLLTRDWDEKLGRVMIVGLNPSTADAENDDPTIRRCINFVKSWGYGGLVMTNLFALRSTDPKRLRNHAQPMGWRNDAVLRRFDDECALTVVAWGAHGTYLGRDQNVLHMLHDPHYLALNKDGTPKHPLYLKSELKPMRMRE